MSHTPVAALDPCVADYRDSSPYEWEGKSSHSSIRTLPASLSTTT
jgi:hypothetical protein